MPFVTTHTFVALATLTAAQLNAVQSNINALWPYTAAGDIPYASAADTLAVLAKPSIDSVLKNTATGTPSWVAEPSTYLIQEQILSVADNEVVFNTGLTGYSQLKAFLTVRGDYASGYVAYANMRINGDTGINYNFLAITNNHSTTVPTYRSDFGVDDIQLSFMPALNADANYASAIEIAILHANNTTFYKNVLIHSASNYKSDGSNSEEWSAGAQWKSTDAVSSITFYPSNGNFIAGSIFTVYGIK